MEIKEIRQKYNLSQIQMSEILWITRQTYVRREKDNKFTIDNKNTLEDHLRKLGLHVTQEDMFDFIKYFPGISIRDLEELLEYMSDNKYLNDKGLKIKTEFWKFIYKNK